MLFFCLWLAFFSDYANSTPLLLHNSIFLLYLILTSEWNCFSVCDLRFFSDHANSTPLLLQNSIFLLYQILTSIFYSKCCFCAFVWLFDFVCAFYIIPLCQYSCHISIKDTHDEVCVSEVKWIKWRWRIQVSWWPLLLLGLFQFTLLRGNPCLLKVIFTIITTTIIISIIFPIIIAIIITMWLLHFTPLS